MHQVSGWRVLEVPIVPAWICGIHGWDVITWAAFIYIFGFAAGYYTRFLWRHHYVE